MYSELNDRLRKALNFRGSAAAMALSNDKPELERLNERIRFCEMLEADPFTLPQKNMRVMVVHIT
jgi:uncharacterized protein (DUF169 family)